jgi:DNA-directed RNA polymerase specialized sigma24 family protein
LPHGVVDARPDPEKLCATREINALVEEHVRQLPPRLQAAFRLRATQGLSDAEARQALGISLGAFKSRMFRARRRLIGGLQQSLGANINALPSGRRGRRAGNCLRDRP